MQYLVDALSLGSLYALGALGIALIFGVMRLVNFAHGSIIACCVFSLIVPSVEAQAQLLAGRLPDWVLVPAVLAVGAGLSVVSEFVVFRRLRQANPATMMIASFALGFTIQNVLLLLYSSRPKSLDLWSQLGQSVELWGARIPFLQLITIGVGLLTLSALSFLLKHTRVGIEMRAAAEDFTMARMLGVRANAVITLTFAISGALAAAIALLLVSQTGVADIRMGLPIMLVAFIATVIGGLGSLAGSVAAGFLLGAVTVLLQVVLPLDARTFRDAFLYLGVIAVLVWRPQGLLASPTTVSRI